MRSMAEVSSETFRCGTLEHGGELYRTAQVSYGDDGVPLMYSVVVRVVHERRPEGTVPFAMPSVCPVCGSA